MFSQKLEQTQAQSHVLAPQLRQSLTILQASKIELRNLILEEIQTNPTLEELPLEEISVENALNKDSKEEEQDEEVKFEEDYRALEKLENDLKEYYFEDKAYEGNPKEIENKIAFKLNSIIEEKNLQDHLLEQVQFLELKKNERIVANYIIGNLDEKGFLKVSTEEIAKACKVSKDLAFRIVKIIRQLDPVGIASYTVQESLIAQLKAKKDPRNKLAEKILKNSYELLLKNKISEIANKFEVSTEEVSESIRILSKLNTAPGSKYNHQSSTPTLVPDVRVWKTDNDEWAIELNKDYIPKFRLNQAYKNLLAKNNIKKTDKNYLQLKLQSSKVLMQALSYRQNTIESITRVLLDLQSDFFNNGPNHLRTLGLQAIADKMNVHETTISRATMNKYIDTPYGVFPYKYFFNKGVKLSNNEAIPSTIIKNKMLQMVENEDKQNPISDNQIANLLKKDDIHLARRTVSKYRSQLKIPAVNLRKKFE